jgi:peptidoglycan/LPS O-acetylase OafA/YrhL
MFAFDFKLPGRVHSALLWLGGISYSLYITHVPIGGRIINLAKHFELSEPMHVPRCARGARHRHSIRGGLLGPD